VGWQELLLQAADGSIMLIWQPGVVTCRSSDVHMCWSRNQVHRLDCVVA
jgi:hypothetical protein